MRRKESASQRPLATIRVNQLRGMRCCHQQRMNDTLDSNGNCTGTQFIQVEQTARREMEMDGNNFGEISNWNLFVSTLIERHCALHADTINISQDE